MKKAKSKQKIKRRRVKFSVEAAEAKEVIFMGDFNSWNSKKHPKGDYQWQQISTCFLIKPETVFI
jgi:1,4-alpha-glucan branching enzyme